MSEENIGLARRCYELFDQKGGLALFAELAHPDAELELPDIYPDMDAFRGRAGAERWQRMVDEAWEEFRFEPEQFFEAGDNVVVFVRVIGRGKESGVELVTPTAHLITIEDGKVKRMRVYLDRDAALRDAGLQAG